MTTLREMLRTCDDAKMNTLLTSLVIYTAHRDIAREPEAVKLICEDFYNNVTEMLDLDVELDESNFRY